MAILFEWYENPVPNDQTDPKTIHARITLNGKVGTDEIRHKIQARSSLTETDVSAVLDALSHIMGEELAEGRQVHLDGIGYFHPTLKCEEGITMETKRKNEKVKLKTYIVNLAYGLKSMATLKIEINGQEFEESSSGDGQYDAFVRALRKIYKVTLGRKFPMLTNYAVTIPPGGRTDAFVQTVITWSYDGTVFRTRGLDADQTEAAIKATMKMLNIIEDDYELKKSE